MQQSSAKRLDERIRSANAEKNKLERELMTVQSELKSGKKAKQGLESENAKLSGRLQLSVNVLVPFVSVFFFVHVLLL